MILREGDVFQDKYRIAKRLGKGGMGVVYRATEIAIERPVAIKCILDLKLVEGDTDLALARLVREAHLLSRVQNPGVVHLYDFGMDDDGVPFMVTEFIEGRNLSYPDGALELPLRARWAGWDPLLESMEAALGILVDVHEEDVIHRDIKPQNLMVQDTHGTEILVRLLDFGLARLLRRRNSADKKWMDRLNRKAIKGTPDYMAPEQFHHRNPESTRLDLYSIGVILHRGLDGEYPYPRFKHFADKNEYIRLREKPPVRSLDPRIPEPLREVVERATEFHPVDRYPDALAMRSALREARRECRTTGGRPVAVQPSPPVSETDVLPSSPGRPGLRRRTPGVHPEECPYLADCLVVLPPSDDAAAASQFEHGVEQVVGWALKKIEFPGAGQLLRLRTLQSSAFFDPDPVKAAEALDRLEYSRVVLWEKTGMDRPGSRLLTLQVAFGNVAAIHCVGHELPEELRHLPSIRYSPRRAGELLTRSREDIHRLVMAVLGQRWRRPALRQQWKHASRDPRVKKLLDETVLTWAAGNKRQALGVANSLASIAGKEPLFQFRRAYLRSRVSGGKAAWRKNAYDLQRVTARIPEYGAAWRELGVAWNRLKRRQRALHCLQEAIRHDPRDYDALASYGGVVRRQAALLEAATEKAFDEALATYGRATRVSDGHPYPLLNWLRLDCRKRHALALDASTRRQLGGLLEERSAQADAGIDLPWCFMDQIEALLYLERPRDAEAALVACLQLPRQDLPTEALETFRDSLLTLVPWYPDRQALEALDGRLATELSNR